MEYPNVEQVPVQRAFSSPLSSPPSTPTLSPEPPQVPALPSPVLPFPVLSPLPCASIENQGPQKRGRVLSNPQPELRRSQCTKK